MFPAVAAFALLQPVPPEYPYFWELAGRFLPVPMHVGAGRQPYFFERPAAWASPTPYQYVDPSSPAAVLADTRKRLARSEERLRQSEGLDRRRDELEPLRADVERLKQRVAELDSKGGR